MKNKTKPDFGYFIKEGLMGIKLHGLMSFAAVTVIAACLLIISTFGLVAYNIDLLIDGLASQNEIAVFVDETLTREQAVAMQAAIEAIDNVEDVTFVPKEEAFENYLETMGEDAYIMEDLREDNPLRDEYRVVMKDVSRHDETVEAIRGLEGVGGTNSEKEISDRLIQIRSVVNAVSYALMALLGAVSVFIIANTVKLAMFARREEISIMKMVGATNGFIRLPFIVEGFTLGMIGAVLAFGLEWVAYDALVQKISQVDALKLFTFVPFENLLVPMLIVFGAAGLFVGVVGSWTSIRKFMDV